MPKSDDTQFPPYVEWLTTNYDLTTEEARLLILIAYDAHGTTMVRNDDINRYIWARDKVRDNPTNSGDTTPA